jgi:hypothetical protein
MTEPTRRGRRTAGDDTALGSVTIGAKEIYDAVVSVTGKVDHLGYSNGELAKRVDKHDVQIAELQARRWPLGVSATAISALGLIVAVAAFIHG